MDLDYRKKSSELVYDLINRDNPQLPVPVSPSNCKLGTPVAIAADGIRNTRIPIMALDGGFYMGSASVTYRRLRQDDLFHQGYPIIEDYLLPADYGANGPTYAHINAVVRWVNNRYGTGFVPEDANIAQVSNAVAKQAIFNFPAANPAWVGAFFWDRRATKKPVSEQVPEVTPTMLTLATGVAPGTKPSNIADFMSYSADFTRFKDFLHGFTASTAMPTSLPARELITYLGAVVERRLSLDIGAQTEPGMAQTHIIRYALPNANVPEANSKDYNYVAVITPPSNGSWFIGRFLLHYKV